MESPRKFNDCYFYYYSTCTKGDNCVFRHEPSALGCETMCAAWQQGKCLDKRCKLRHMELRKNRKQIPCYWETQPGGCRKKHCPFMHKNPEARTDGIAPSQPGPVHPQAQVVSAEVIEHQPQSLPLPSLPSAPLPAQPIPMLWQHQHQQRQVVLDSAILGVLPANADLMGGRRVMPAHHEQQPPYAPLPVDPLVVNFEEESDNESAPSSTPTKNVSPDEERIARTKSQELLLLERIQAETAALYSYDHLPPPEPKAKVNLSIKYDRLSLDDITGRQKLQAVERRSSLDFKVLSLDEIRARKKVDHTAIHAAPITLNLRKRKLSTQETVTTEGNKMIKVVRSNSIVYKKVDRMLLSASVEKESGSDEPKSTSEGETRKRTISEIDIYDLQDDELVDNCYEFKKIKIAEATTSTKPRLIRNRIGVETHSAESREIEISNKTDDSDNDVEIISVELPDSSANADLSDSEVIVVNSTSHVSETIDLVDLSEDLENDRIPDQVSELGTSTNVPDIVASCQKNRVNSPEKDIDSILNETPQEILDDDDDSDL